MQAMGGSDVPDDDGRCVVLCAGKEDRGSRNAHHLSLLELGAKIGHRNADGGDPLSNCRDAFVPDVHDEVDGGGEQQGYIAAVENLDAVGDDETAVDDQKNG